jgi:sugar phosphate isomerase/epimerase
MSTKISLYSITYLGIWYDGPALTWKEVLHRAKKFGYDGVEFDAKRPHANPMDWCADTRKAVVDEAGSLGIELYALSANNDFSSPVPELREAQLLMVKEQLRLAADLGCKVLRVFAAWRGITMHNGIASYDLTRHNSQVSFAGYPMADRRRFVIECLKECTKYAEEYGVVLALQNHRPLVMDWMDVYNIVRVVDSPWLKICYDLPKEEDDDKKWITRGFDTIGDLDVHFHFNGEWKRDANGKSVVAQLHGRDYVTNYPHFIKEMHRIGYKGHISYEYCHQALNDKFEIQGLDYIDNQAQLALEYMRGLVADAEK